MTGLPDPIVRDGFIEVWDRPGMGVVFTVEVAGAYLPEADRDLFEQRETRVADSCTEVPTCVALVGNPHQFLSLGRRGYD